MDERRQGMDEMSEKIGEVRAGLVGLNQRLDALSLERQQQHGEAIKALTDSQAQYHEIKHELENVGTKFNAIEYKIGTHQTDDKRDHESVLLRLDRHQASADTGMAELAKQIAANRAAADAREAVMVIRLDDLFAWRNRMRGAKAVISAAVGGLLVVFGHDILEFGKSLFHWGAK